MEIQLAIEKGKTERLSLSDLQAVAHDRRAFGEDLVELFTSQAERLQAETGAILDRAKGENRDLLASEKRDIDRNIKAVDQIRSLRTMVADRTAQKAFVPETQLASAETRGPRTGLFGCELRALAAGSGEGALISPQEFNSNFFDRLAAQSVFLRAGAQRLTTDRNSVKVPKLVADPAANFLSEAGTISPTDPDYDEITATPVKIGSLTVMSNELIADSNPSVLSLLEMQTARALALKYDLACFEANETNLKGLKNTTGITLDSSLGANGGTPANLDVIASAITTLATENAEAKAIFCHPRTWGTLIKIKEVSGSTKPLLQDSAGSGSQGVVRSAYGVPVFLTSQLSITETKGSSTDCSSIYVVDMAHVVAVFRQDVRIELDRSRLFNTDQSELRAIMRATLAVPNAKAVVRIEGVRP